MVDYGAQYYSYLYARCLAATAWQQLMAGDPFDPAAGETSTGPGCCSFPSPCSQPGRGPLARTGQAERCGVGRQNLFPGGFCVDWRGFWNFKDECRGHPPLWQPAFVAATLKSPLWMACSRKAPTGQAHRLQPLTQAPQRLAPPRLQPQNPRP